MLASGPGQMSLRTPSQPISPLNQPNPFEAEMAVSGLHLKSDWSSSRPETETLSAILMRKLPSTTSSEALRTMFLFAKDFVSADFVPTDSPEDKGYLSAIARFRTSTAAFEARALLDGKQNTPNEAPMVVEVLRLSPAGFGLRRNTFDISSRSSTASSTGQAARQSSRFTNTFQTIDRVSPPTAAHALSHESSMNNPVEHSGTDALSPYQPFFPSSAIGQPLVDRPRVSGKSVIGEDSLEDEPGELLKDPVAFAKNGMSASAGQMSRRATNPQLPTARLAGLTLSTGNATSPPMQGLSSPRTAAPLQSPTSALSPTSMSNLGPNASYQMANQHYQRHNYPPVNPADQNPPCNTLYVGNLPIDTSEDELKAMFSKQRGYKRLCFRTKQNGPMCFVEFEDISFATKALNELYGHPLHNSVKGGIRLSFSKNPLGVRTNQHGAIGPSTPMTPQGPIPIMAGIGSMQSFSTVNGPPPGLSAPPGLGTALSGSAGPMNGLTSPNGGNVANSGFGMGGLVANGLRSPPALSTAGNTTNSPWAGPTSGFADHMFGR